MCVCVSMYTSIYIHVCIYIYIYIYNTYLCTYNHNIFTCVNIPESHTSIHTYLVLPLNARVHTYKHMYIHTHIYIYIHIHIHVYRYVKRLDDRPHHSIDGILIHIYIHKQ